MALPVRIAGFAQPAHAQHGRPQGDGQQPGECAKQNHARLVQVLRQQRAALVAGRPPQPRQGRRGRKARDEGRRQRRRHGDQAGRAGPAPAFSALL
jgi:hypothetical protein